MVGAHRREVEVVEAIVVVVGNRAAEAIGFDGEPGLLSDVGEGAVVIVVVERGERLGAGGMAGPVHGIDEEDVLPAVIVVIEKTNAAAHGFGKIFFTEGAGVVLEMDASF